MKTTLLAAFGLMLVIEGLLPFAAPQTWRDTFKRMVELKNGQLRFVGLLSILGGLVLLYLSH